jgi:hypothetical protein
MHAAIVTTAEDKGLPANISPGMLTRTTAAVPARGSICVENTMPAAAAAAASSKMSATTLTIELQQPPCLTTAAAAPPPQGSSGIIPCHALPPVIVLCLQQGQARGVESCQTSPTIITSFLF